MPTDPLMAQYASSAAPNNPPDATVAIAGSAGNATDAIDGAQSLAAVGAATTQMAHLQSLSADQQRGYWAGATSAEQSMLTGVGYQPPGGHRSIISRAFHDYFGAPAAAYHGKYGVTKIPVVGSVIQKVVHDVAEGPKKVGSFVLDAYQSGNELAKHTFRAGAYDAALQNSPVNGIPLVDNVADLGIGIADDVKAAAHFVAPILHLSTPSDWADAWHATTVGDRTFDPNKLRDLQVTSGLDDMTFNLAKAAASSDKDVSTFLAEQLKAGMKPEDVAALGLKVHDQGAPMTPEQLQASQAFHDTVEQLKDSKLSFGRSLVPDWMWQSNPHQAHFVSGLGDAVFSFADPTIIGSKVNKAAKVAKYGFRTLDDLRKVTQTKGFQAWAADVAGYLAKDDVSGLLKRYPSLDPISTHLQRSGATTAEDITRLATPGDRSALDAAEAERTAARNAVDDSVTEAEQKKAIKAAGLADVKTEKEFSDYVEGSFLALHIFAGNGSAISDGVKLVPTLTTAGKAYLDSKGALTKLINYTRDVALDVGPDGAKDLSGQIKSGTIGLFGTTAKRLVSLIPQGASFKPMDANAVTTIRNFAQTYLPSAAVDALVRDWTRATDLSAKRDVYTEMLSKVLTASGADLSDDSDLARHFVNVINQDGVSQKYTAFNRDLLENDNGTVSAHGFLEKHMTQEWSLPSVKELFANADRGRLNKMVYGISNNFLAQSFSTIWKPLQLLRMGFPVRVSLEEAAGAVARNGPFEVAKARLASRAIGSIVTNGEREGYGMVGPMSDFNPLEAMFARGFKMLPKPIRPSVESAQHLQALILANRTTRAVRWTAGKVPGVQALVDTALRYPNIFKHSFTSEASAIQAGKYGFTNDVADGEIGKKFGDRMRKTSVSALKPTGEYQQIENGDDFFLTHWSKHLDDMAGSGVARKVLSNAKLIESDPEQLRTIIANYMLQPRFKDTWAASIRSRKLRDKRVVGYDATKEDAARDWADVVIDHVNHMLPKGEMTDEGMNTNHRDALVKSLLDDKESPDHFGLRKIPLENRPDAIPAQAMDELPTGGIKGLFGEFVNKGFTRMGGAMDSWSRQPLYLAAVHKADKHLTPLVHEMFGDSEFADELRQELVRRQADSEILPFIHDPKVRSQMNVLTQNLAPFQFAQEQFWKRWARTFVHSPEAMREAQLAHHALGATGLTHTNDAGQEIFTYPLSGFAQKAVTEGLNVMGQDATLPVQQAFTGELKMVAPGLDRTFAPSFGPLVSIPLNKLAQKFPELRPTQHAVLGDIGTNRTVAEQIFPSTILRVLRISNDDRTSTQYANAEMRAIQDIYGAKHGLPPNATAAEREQFMARVKNWTRINMGIRAFLGFGLPAAPITEIGDTKIAHELRVLSDSGMDFTAAMQALVERDPDAFPYTVFQSAGTGAATLPATAASVEMLNKYASFFDKHLSAGGFFLPTATKDDAYSNEAYQEQLMAGLRQRRTPKEFLEQIMFKQGADDYYATVDAYNARVKNLKGAARDEQANIFSKWKEQYLKDHPVFGEVLQDPTARNKRTETLTDLQKALNDPSAPQTPQAKQIADLVATYNGYLSRTGAIGGMRSALATKQRADMKFEFATWAKQYAKDNPGALDVYNRLVRPDVDPDGATTAGAA